MTGTDFSLLSTDNFFGRVMATYLLLRSNKESGPYTREQLQQLGLKPYDLVWVEGKSAAWRYPGEVAELREFAPMVEEQPFDRFYKQIPDKAEKHFHELVEEARKKEKAQPAVEMKTEKVLSKVFVSLPGELSESVAAAAEKKQEPLFVAKGKTGPLIVPDQKAEPVIRVEQKKEIEIPVKKAEPQIVPDQKTETAIPVEQKKEIEIPVVRVLPRNEPVRKEELKEEYSQPLSEIKKQYAEIYLNRKQKTANRRNLVKIFQMAGAALFVLALGTLIYLTVKPEKPAVFTNGKNLQTKEAKPAETTGQPLLPPEQTENKEPVRHNVTGNNDEPGAAKTEKLSNRNETAKTTEEKNDEPVLTEVIQKNPPVSADPSTGERNKTIRGNAEQIKIKPASLNTLVSVKANEYKRKAFGGIENLQLTVVNSSSFVVDKVIVELQYLKPSELPLKTETIEFNSIAPNGAMTIKIPDNPRGIKVTYKILQVESSQYDKSTAGL